MARKPLSTYSSKPSAHSGKPASPILSSPKQAKNSSTMTTAIIATVVIAALIGIFVYINKSNTDQQNAIARQAAENKRIEAENKARAEEHKKQVAEAKAAKKAKMEEAAKKAEEEAARRQQETTPDSGADTQPDDQADDTPPADDTAEPSPEAPPGDDGTDTPADDEPDAGDDSDDAGAESAEGELVVTPSANADPANAKRLIAMARKAGETGEYEDFAAMLKGKLEAAYPANMKVKDDALPTPISKANTGEAARCLYLGLALALESAEESPAKEQEAFVKWLLTSKQQPALTFGKSLARFKVTEHADALGMMSELRQAYKDEPKKAFAKIKNITNPLDHNVSKKLYPHSKKDILSTINKLKNVKQKGTLDAEQQDAVNLVNVYRYLCGLPTDVVYDKKYHEEASEAAEACKQAGHIAHDLGHYTDKCNLFAGISGPPSQTVSGYMADNGENNRQARGHRAWILYPGTGKTAFGKVGSYQAMRTMDGSSGHRPKTAWSYPGRGYFPVDYLHGKGWSWYCPPGVTMGEEKEVKVEMWSVPKGLKAKPDPKRLTKANSIPILNVYAHKGAYMPTGNTIVFEPDYDKLKQMKGKITGTYWIRISWPGFADEYVVEFF